MPPAETLICFSSKRIEIHPCPQCRYPMTHISDKSSNSITGLRSFHCFNCDDAGKSRFLCPGSVHLFEVRTELSAASTEVCPLATCTA
jgi:hypothetical protein